jgi:hypothetical protein
MDFLTLLGIIFNGLGLLLISLNLKFKFINKTSSVIIGVILITIGTITITKKSSDNLEIINTNISEFRVILYETLKDTSFDSEYERVNEISEKFEDWAQEFTKSRNIKELDYKKQDIIYKQKELIENEKFYDNYCYIIKTIESLIVQYNKTSTNRILYISPDIPKNLFSEEINDYSFYLKTNKYLWRIWFYNGKIKEKVNYPKLMISSRALNEYMEKDTISNLDLFISDFSPIEIFIFKEEFSISYNYYSSENEWTIRQHYGNINHKLIDHTNIKNKNFYKELDNYLFKIIEFIVLN